MLDFSSENVEATLQPKRCVGVKVFCTLQRKEPWPVNMLHLSLL